MKEPKRLPHRPAAFADRDAYAIKAFARGEATADEQARAFNWIMASTGVRNEIFVQGQEDTRLYLMGRRSIGLQIAHLLEWVPKKESKSE